RLKLAEELGASATINGKSADAASELKRLTEGKGVDVAMEAVGSTPTIKLAVESVRKGGTVGLIGNIAPTAEIPLQVVVSRQLCLQGSAASSGEYPRCIELLSRGEINLKPLISVVAPLEEGADWFARLHSKQANLMKVILRPAA
ncbi:MAG: zinc-binding dehydrogenase, partial [Acidobacteriaceae bacterium]|nr:zinc-binding dehydrogenase [Acidobacteriaceae bacterium]